LIIDDWGLYRVLDSLHWKLSFISMPHFQFHARVLCGIRKTLTIYHKHCLTSIFLIHLLLIRLIQWNCSIYFLCKKPIYSHSFHFLGFYDVMLSFLTKEITRTEKRSLKKQITFRNDHFIKFSLHVVIIALTLPPTNSSAMTSTEWKEH